MRGAVPRGEGAGRGAWPGHVTRDLDHDAGDGEGPQLEDTQQHEEAVRWPVLHSQVGLYSLDRSELHIDN